LSEVIMSVNTVGNNQNAEVNSENTVQDNLTVYTGLQGWILAKMGYAIQIWNDAEKKVVYLNLKDIVAEMTKTPNGSISGNQIGECRKVRSAAAQILNLQKAGERITGEEVVNFIADFRSDEGFLGKIQSAENLPAAVEAVQDRANQVSRRISLVIEHIPAGEEIGELVKKCRVSWFKAWFHETISVRDEDSKKTVYLSLPGLVAVMARTPNKNITGEMLGKCKEITRLVRQTLEFQNQGKALTGEQVVSLIEDFRDDEDFLSKKLGTTSDLENAKKLIATRFNELQAE